MPNTAVGTARVRKDRLARGGIPNGHATTSTGEALAAGIAIIAIFERDFNGAD